MNFDNEEQQQLHYVILAEKIQHAWFYSSFHHGRNMDKQLGKLGFRQLGCLTVSDSIKEDT